MAQRGFDLAALFPSRRESRSFDFLRLFFLLLLLLLLLLRAARPEDSTVFSLFLASNPTRELLSLRRSLLCAVASSFERRDLRALARSSADLEQKSECVSAESTLHSPPLLPEEDASASVVAVFFSPCFKGQHLVPLARCLPGLSALSLHRGCLEQAACFGALSLKRRAHFFFRASTLFEKPFEQAFVSSSSLFWPCAPRGSFETTPNRKRIAFSSAILLPLLKCSSGSSDKGPTAGVPEAALEEATRPPGRSTPSKSSAR